MRNDVTGGVGNDDATHIQECYLKWQHIHERYYKKYSCMLSTINNMNEGGLVYNDGTNGWNLRRLK